MSEVLAEVTRGTIVESRHHGHVAVCDSEGRLLAFAGDPNRVTYWRSAAKPFQAMNVVLTGAADAFKLTDPELAITCSSHYGEEYHVKTVQSILRKAGVDLKRMLCGSATSLNPKFARQMAWDHVAPHPLFNDCSGKHAGMLAVCAHRLFELPSYLTPHHPMQRQILEIIAFMTGYPREKIQIGIDGCSAPVHALSLYGMARAYALLGSPDRLPQDFKVAAERIYRVMFQNPEMIAGTGGFCTELMRITHGKLIGKVGAEGIYCIGVRQRNLGIAIKLESGVKELLSPVAVRLLQDLDLLSPQELTRLSEFQVIPNLNDVRTQVGEIRAAAFELNRCKV